MSTDDFKVKNFIPIYWSLLWRYVLYDFLCTMGFGIVYMLAVNFFGIDANKIPKTLLAALGLMIALFVFYAVIKKIFIKLTDTKTAVKKISNVYWSILWRFLVYEFLILFLPIFVLSLLEFDFETFSGKAERLFFILVLIAGSFEAARKGFKIHIVTKTQIR